MKNICLFFFLIVSVKMVAQTDVLTLQNEIDKTVWKPFQKAFEALDGEALNSLYAENVLRVISDKIDTKGDFKIKNIENFLAAKKNNVSIKLDFWLDSRSTNEDISYEIGFFRINRTTDGNSNVYYGQFHIVLQKINGEWKITQDWDASTVNGKKIGKDDFERKEALRF